MQRTTSVKKMISVLAVFLLLLTASPFALAADPIWLAEAQYDDAWSFSDGMARVMLDGKYGYIDASGKLAIPAKYANATNFGDGAAWVLEDGLWSIIDKKGQIIFTLTDKRFAFTIDGVPSVFQDGYSILHGFGNLTDIEACSLVYTPYGDLVFFTSGYLQGFHDGISWSFMPGVNNPLGFVDTRGRFTNTSEIKNARINYTYSAAKPFSGGLAAVCDRDTQKWGFIDKTGKRAFYSEYDNVSYFNEGLAPICINGLWGYVNDKGSMIIKPQYSAAFPMNDGQGLVIQSDKAGLIDAQGQFIVEPQFDGFYFSGCLVGTTLIPETYYSGGRAKVQTGDVFGFADASGYMVIPASYDDAYGFQDGIAPVMQNDLWGYIDVNGNELIAPQFSRADVFHENAALVQKNGKWGFIANPSQMPSDWAVAEIEAARTEQLIPGDLDGFYTSNVTRIEFCQLAINWLTVKSGRDAASFVSNDADTPSFTDTSDPSVLTAAKLGIVTGHGGGRFDPYGLINREEAATMLYRTARVLTPSLKSGNAQSFSDSADFSDWAKDAIAFVSSAKDKNGKNVMGGTGNNRFDAKGYYTREQSFLTMIRLFTA